MALSKRAKVGIGIGVMAMVVLGAGIAMAGGEKPKKRRASSLEEAEDGRLRIPSPSSVEEDKDDDDDDDDGIDLDASPAQPAPTVTTPGVFPPLVTTSTDGGTVVKVPGLGEVVIPPGVNLGPITPEVTTPSPDPNPIPVTLPPLPTLPVPTVNPTDEDAGLMVADLLAAERAPGWKRKYDSVTAWQLAAGRPVDGKFGPGDALVVAQTVGRIPVIRYWPAKDGVNPQRAISDYRNALLTIAATKSPQHAAELKASAAKERGQSFGPPTGTGGKGPAV